MTKIINGYAQPDVVGTREGRKLVVFIEDAQSFKENIESIVMTLRELALGKSEYYMLEDIEEIRITLTK